MTSSYLYENRIIFALNPTSYYLVSYSDPHYNIVSTLGVSSNGGASSEIEGTGTPKAMAKQEVSLRKSSSYRPS